MGIERGADDPAQRALSRRVHARPHQEGAAGWWLGAREGGSTEVIITDVPEWRIVDDATWFAVNERFTTRGPSARTGRPTGKYPLSGIAKCGSCSGAVGAARVVAYGGPNERVLCYGCAKHHDCGSAVCAVTVHQPMVEVENAIVAHLQQHVLSEGVLDLVLAEIRTELAAQLPKRDADVAALEAELATARTEQKRLAKAVALADDVAELVSELRKRLQLISSLEVRIASAKRTPDEVVSLVTTIEEVARRRLRDLRTALAERRDLRDIFLALFPEGLTFTPGRAPEGGRQVWRIAGSANLQSLMEAPPVRVATPDPSEQPGKARRVHGSARSDVGGFDPPVCVATPTGFEPVLPA